MNIKDRERVKLISSRITSAMALDDKYIKYNVDLDDFDEVIDKIKELNNLLKGKTIVCFYTGEYLTTDKLKKIIAVRDELTKFGANLLIEDGDFWDLDTVILANDKIDDVVSLANNYRVLGENNRPLNDYEKFLIAYTFVKDRKYKENTTDIAMSRCITSILQKGDVVCVGFAKLLKEICNRMGIECYQNSCSINKPGKKKEYHENNIVVIEGRAYYCDACWDCYTDLSKNMEYTHCLIPCEDAHNMIEKDDDGNYVDLTISDCDAPYFDLSNDIEKLKESVDKIKSGKCYNDWADLVFIKYNFMITKEMANLPSLDKLKYIISKLRQIDNNHCIKYSDFEKYLYNANLAMGMTESKAKEYTLECLYYSRNRSTEIFNSKANNLFTKSNNLIF